MNKIIGHNKTEINIIEKNDYTEKVGIIYPGQTYLLNSPSLYYMKQIFSKLGIHYYGFDWNYGINTEFIETDSQTRNKWIEKDAETIGKHLIEKTKSYSKRIFIAKSLGTKHLFHQMKCSYIDKEDILIFQTPVIPFTELQDFLLKTGNISLIIYGTNDSVIAKKNYQQIESQKNVSVIEIENAGHVFEEDNNIEQTLENLKKVVLETELFLKSKI